jgi:hypothetical protein
MPQAMPHAGSNCEPVGVGTLQICKSGIALCKIFEGKLTRCHTAPENKTAVAIIRYDVIVRFRLDRDRRKRLVAHARNMKMSFALTIQILFPQICVTTL